MNTAHITTKTLTLELEGTTYTENITDKETGRKRLLGLIQEKAAATGSTDIAVHVQGEEPIGLRYASGKVSKIDVPQQAAQPAVKEPQAEPVEPIAPIDLDEMDDDALDMPVLEGRTMREEAAETKASEPVSPAPVAAPQPTAVSRPSVAAHAATNTSKPTAEQFYTAKPTTAEEPARQGWRGMLNSFGLSLAPSNEELSERKARREIQRGLKSHKTIMVANLKGGAGKTTVAYLLSSVLGRVRGGTVLAWDNNENRGTLAYRSPIEANTTNTAIDLLHEMSFFENSGQTAELINFVRPQGENKFDLLASQHQGSDKPVINGEGFISLHNLLRSFYRMMIIDTGNASNASTWQAAAATADEMVIVCSNAEDSAQTAAETIDALIKKGYQEKVENSVAVIIDSAKNKDRTKAKADKERLERIQNHLAQHVRAVHVLPWETSLENGGAIEWDKLTPKTHRALIDVSASVVAGL
ncbi:ATPase [Mycobacteroides abscessus subsp. bolletii]|nr:ATPase [Mycobacteroides abscessus subsp. bolletii]